jgi:hypothetical protein
MKKEKYRIDTDVDGVEWTVCHSCTLEEAKTVLAEFLDNQIAMPEPVDSITLSIDVQGLY